MKVFIISTAVIALGFSMYGALSLKVGFDVNWYLNPDSATLKMLEYGDKYFPTFNETKGDYYY